MKSKLNLFKGLILLAFLGGSFHAFSQVNSQQAMLDSARHLFHQSIEDKSHIEPALSLFQKIAQKHPSYRGRAIAYTGALYALIGKHSFWPHDKLLWVKEGLKFLDKGIAINPDDIEALFIRGTTCHYLPFFFEEKANAERDFRRIAELLPEQYQQYDEEMLKHAIEFIVEYSDLSEENFQVLREMQIRLANK